VAEKAGYLLKEKAGGPRGWFEKGNGYKAFDYI